MKLVEVLNGVSNKINKLISWLVIVLFGIMFLACVWQVITKYLLNNSATWTDETARYTFIWATMLSATVLSWKQGHAVLSFIVDRMPKKLGAAFRIFSEGMVIWIGVILVKYAGLPMKTAALQKSPALHLRMDFIYVAVPICGCLFVLYAVTHIVAQAD